MTTSSENTKAGALIVALSGAIALMAAGGRGPLSLGRVLTVTLSNPVPTIGTAGGRGKASVADRRIAA